MGLEIFKSCELNQENKEFDVDLLLKFNYEKLVLFLKKKYGEIKKDYFYNDLKWNKNSTIGRGSEGLYIHHIDEDKAIMLSNKEFAMHNIFEYQKADRLVYCNLLEHLILHIKITEEPNWDGNCGIGGVYNYIVPELNDIFSGIQYKQPWKQYVIKITLPFKNQYLRIMEYISNLKWNGKVNLFTSFNENYGLWENIKNKELYMELKKIGIKEFIVNYEIKDFLKRIKKQK